MGRGSGHKKKFCNPNPVPRDPKTLPDVEKELLQYNSFIVKICADLKRQWWQQIYVPDIEEEIRQTVLAAFSSEWDRFRKGEIDNFPPNAAFLFTVAKYNMIKAWAPKDDVVTICTNDPYESTELTNMWVLNKNSGKALFRHRARVYHEGIGIDPFDIEGCAEYKDSYPDLVDWWCMGFSLLELAVVFATAPETIRKRLHNYYDAMEIAGITVERERPPTKVPRNKLKEIEKWRERERKYTRRRAKRRIAAREARKKAEGESLRETADKLANSTSN